MTALATKPRKKNSPQVVQPPRNGQMRSSSDVFTLAELANYLRVTPVEVEQLVTQQKLPGRRVGSDWRFLKSAIDDWLRKPEPDFWTSQWGALRDDPTLEAFLRETARQRGRPMSEDA